MKKTLEKWGKCWKNAKNTGKVYEKYWKNAKKTGKVREIRQSKKVGTMEKPTIGYSIPDEIPTTCFQLSELV